MSELNSLRLGRAARATPPVPSTYFVRQPREQHGQAERDERQVQAPDPQGGEARPAGRRAPAAPARRRDGRLEGPAVVDHQDRRGEGAHAEEGAVADGDLAVEAGEQVEAHGRDGQVDGLGQQPVVARARSRTARTGRPAARTTPMTTRAMNTGRGHRRPQVRRRLRDSARPRSGGADQPRLDGRAGLVGRHQTRSTVRLPNRPLGDHHQHHQDERQRQHHLDAVEGVDVLDRQRVGHAHDRSRRRPPPTGCRSRRARPRPGRRRGPSA